MRRLLLNSEDSPFQERRGVSSEGPTRCGLLGYAPLQVLKERDPVLVLVEKVVDRPEPHSWVR